MERIKGYVSGERSRYVVTVNSEFVIKAQKDAAFRDILNSADLAIPDGIGILMAGKYQQRCRAVRTKYKKSRLSVFDKAGCLALYMLEGLKVGLSVFINPSYLDVIPERIAGADLIFDILEFCEDNDKKLFILGRDDGLSGVDVVVRELEKRYPRLEIKGEEAAVRGLTLSFKDEGLRKRITKYEADVLFISLGMGIQEKWIYENRDLNASLSIGLGGSLDYLVGVQKRSPLWMRKLGLEWFGRLFSAGDTVKNKLIRLRRISDAVIIFPVKVFRESLKGLD